MATPPIKTKVAIEGEKEYRQALSEINNGLKVLSSEMKLVTAQFVENADGIEALTAKGDILERQMLTQKEKIDTLREALQKSAEAYGESDTRTAKWQVSLNNAEAQLLTMQRELDRNREALEKATAAAADAENAYKDMDKALEDSGDSANDSRSIFERLRDALGDADDSGKSFGDMADDLAKKLGINLPDGAKKALDVLGQVDGKTAALAGSLAAIAAAVVTIEKALINLTTERAEVATQISNISQTINMSVEATQKWDYVLKTVGSSIEEAQGDLSAFQEKIMEANTGTGEAAEMFAKLGVNVADQSGKLRDTESVLLDTINALQLMADETDRNATSSTLLGGTGEKLIPIYNQSAEALQYLLDRKHELGIVTGDEIEALKDVSEALLEYEERSNSAKDTIAAEFAPALEEFYEMAGKSIQNLGEAAKESGLINFFGSLLEIVTSLTPLLDSIGSIAEALGPVFDVAAIGISAAADSLSVLADMLAIVIDLITLDFSSALENWDHLMSLFSGNSAIVRATSSVNNRLAEKFENLFGINPIEEFYWNPREGERYGLVDMFMEALKLNASGDYNYDGGYTWVGENGPELAYLPQGTRIFSNQESRSMGGDTWYVTIDAKNVKEFNDIVKMAKAKRRTDRQKGGS